MGAAAKEILWGLLDSCDYSVYPFGYESTFSTLKRGLRENERLKDNDIAQRVRSMPDFLVHHKDELPQPVEVKFRKAQELGRFLLGESPALNFSEPKPDLPQEETTLLRRRILDLSQKDAESLGISKSTLHYPRSRAHEGQPFRVYGKTAIRLK